MEHNQIDKEIVSVAIVAICGPAHLLRCLAALSVQRNAPPFDIVVVYDPSLSGMEVVSDQYPNIKILANEGQRSPLELASRALLNSQGDIILLTEDHCVPDQNWVSNLSQAFDEGYAAVGGVVQTYDDVSSVDWAFYFVDFYRYAHPVSNSPSATLTVCNVAYRRSELKKIEPSWKNFFHETAVNDELKTRFGPLKLTGEAQVSMSRHVRFSNAIRERYAYGRLFGCTRLKHATQQQRLIYILGAPVLPILIMARMLRKALINKLLCKQFIRSFVPLSCMVLAWSWGEWLGYLTHRRPEDLSAAQERTD